MQELIDIRKLPVHTRREVVFGYIVNAKRTGKKPTNTTFTTKLEPYYGEVEGCINSFNLEEFEGDRLRELLKYVFNNLEGKDNTVIRLNRSFVGLSLYVCTIKKEERADTHKLWEFIENHHPDYHHSNEILLSDILQRYLDGEDVSKEDILMMREMFPVMSKSAISDRLKIINHDIMFDAIINFQNKKS